jgi:thermitase
MGNFVRAAKIAVIMTATVVPLFSFGAEPESVPGEYLVKLKAKLKDQSREALQDTLKAEILRKHEDLRIVVIKKPLVELPSKVVQALKENPFVETAEPNFVYRAEKLPSDPEFGKLWGLKNTGQEDSRQSGVADVDIDVEKAWDITTGSDEVIVAVIDTGIDFNHPDLKDNMWINEAEKNGVTGIDDDGNGYVDDINGFNFTVAENPNPNPMDDNGHGSHCAGTIGARGDSVGIVGVNWNVKLMPVKFLSAGGGGSLEGAILAIDYAVKNKAKILSNSWGGGGESQLLKEAIQRSADAGTLFVAAAGNDGWNTDDNPHFPSSYPVDNILSVAAVDNQGNLASFSNHGKRSVDLGAPGLNVYSSYMTGGYKWLSGTSMATPHVSGIAALLLAHNPDLSGMDLKKQIMTTTRGLPSLRNKVVSGGMANAFYALTDYHMPPDMNDPYFWDFKSLAISNSTHPYGKNTRETFDIEVPGAKEMALYFEKFETERRYDKLSFYDRAGNLLYEMTGYQNDSFSPAIAGDWVRLVLTSDNSVEKYGFNLTKVSYR